MKFWQRAWSLVDGCTHVSEGCDHCWLAGMAHRFGHDFSKVDFRADRLDIPLRTRKPTVWAVWSDLYHPSVTDDQIDRAVLSMLACPEHVFLIISKRPERAVEYMKNCIDRLNYLLYTIKYEKRTDSPSTGNDGRVADRCKWGDMAAQKTAWARSEARRRLLHRINGVAVSKSEGGVCSNARVSSGINNDHRESYNCDGSPDGLGVFQRADTGRDDDKSQERNQKRQQAYQPRTDDSSTATQARARSAECQQEPPKGQPTPQDLSDGVGCAGNETASGRWDDGKANSGTVQNEKKSNICNLHGQDVETHLTAFPDNVYHLITVENQARADERMPYALQIPGKVGILAEPLLGAIDISRYIINISCVITGGETGSGARPAHPDWFRSLRDQCHMAGVPFMFKSWGDYIEMGCGLKGHPMKEAGWSRKGRVLDGQEHNELPWRAQ